MISRFAFSRSTSGNVTKEQVFPFLLIPICLHAKYPRLTRLGTTPITLQFSNLLHVIICLDFLHFAERDPSKKRHLD